MKEGVFLITDLTEGKPSQALLKFSLPMLWSAMFQQLYNICDSVIAGKFAGEDALAAVGGSYPVTQIFMAVALGCNVGASVVIAQLFGAKKYSDMKTAVNTAYISFSVLSIILTLAGIFGGDIMLRRLATPDNIFADSSLYLKVYSAGMLFVFMYNICTGVFTALGDSKTPLYFLIASSIGNILLDLLFVAVFSMGVGGVAWATFIAQGAACAAAFVILNRRLKTIETAAPPKLFSLRMFGNISFMAVPSILQQSFVSVGNLFIQNLVNSFGSSVMAGYSAAIKLNTFAVTSFNTLGNGISNFTAQNIGARKTERIPQGFRAGTAIGLCVALPVSLLYFFGGRFMLMLFLNDGGSRAVSTGMDFLRTVSPFYAFVCVKLAADGVERGARKMLCFMISTFSDLILRVVLAYCFVGPFNEMGIWYSWPVGWVASAVIAVTFYLMKVWKKGVGKY